MVIKPCRPHESDITPSMKNSNNEYKTTISIIHIYIHVIIKHPKYLAYYNKIYVDAMSLAM